MKKFLFVSLMVSLLAFASFGCKPDNAATNAGSKPAVQTSQKAFAEITDSEKRNVVLTKKPERVVVMDYRPSFQQQSLCDSPFHGKSRRRRPRV